METKTVSFVICCATLIGSVFLFIHFAKGANTDIIITEIGAYETSGHEWIEVHNKGTEPIDMTDWKFWEAGVNHGLALSQGDDSIIEPGEYAIIAQNDINFLQDYPSVSSTVFDSSWSSLKESGEEIGLKDADGAIAEQFVYIAAPDFSLERKNPALADYSADNWTEHPNGNSAGMQNYWYTGESGATEENMPPSAAIYAPTSTLVNTPVLFSAASSTDADGLIMHYGWKFGDEGEAEGLSTSHTYSTTGTFSILLTVVDNDAASSTASTTIAIFDPEPEEESVEEPADVRIVINEFMPNPESGQKEWIELYNTATTTTDLTGVTIEDGTGNTIASPSSTISGQSFLSITLSSAKLNNSGDIIILKNAMGDSIDQVTYGDWEDDDTTDNAAAPKQAHSLARITDGYDSDMDYLDFAETDTPTPSEANRITESIEEEQPNDEPAQQTPTPTSAVYHAGDIVINELVSDPADGYDEFVELYNTTNQPITLDGWWIEEGSGSKSLLSETIAAHGFFVIEKPKGNLNNDGDIVRLFAPNGLAVDRAAYGAWDDGNMADNAPKADDPMSIARMFDGKDTDNDANDFARTTVITRGGPNSIAAPLPQTEEEIEDVSEETQDIIIYSEYIIVTEVFPNPKGSDGEEEFIEIKNTGTKEINLDGWKIGDASTRRYTITNTVIAPNEYLAFKRKQTGIALNNTGGDAATIYAPNGNSIDTMSYKDSATEGESYARMDDNRWKWTRRPTPGEQNIIEEIPPLVNEAETIERSTDKTITEQTIAENHYADIDTGVISLSEFLPNPVGSDDAEFIEVFNASDLAIDLSKLKLDDEDGGSRPYTIPEGTVIPPRAYLVFPREQTKIALNNTGDSVRLLQPNGEIIESVEYTTLPEGTSYAKNEDSEWFPTGTPTPGTKNIFSIPKAVAGTKIQQTNQPAEHMPIADIHNADPGDRITTIGTVIVEPGIFGSQYFYIVDASASSTLPGIQIYMYSKDFPDLAIGDQIIVTGEITEARGETRVKIAERTDIETVDYIGEPQPVRIEIASIGALLIGSFVEVTGEITELKGSYMYVDDGTEEIKIYFKSGTGISKESFSLGGLVIVKGIVNQAASGYQLLPRAQADIIKTGIAQEAAIIEQKEEKKENEEVAEKYLTATAGGLTAILLGLILKSNMPAIMSFFARFKKKKNGK